MSYKLSDRSRSAPTIQRYRSRSLFENESGSRLFKDDQLCAWNDTEHPSPFCRYYDVKTSNKDAAKSNYVNNLKNSNSSTNTKNKLSKSCTKKDKKETEKSVDYVFKHFTDCDRYIVDYRERKWQKMKEFLGQGYFNQYSSSPSNASTTNSLGNNSKRTPICLKLSHEHISYGYRIEKSQRRHKLNSSYGDIIKSDLSKSPMKVWGGKCFDYDQNGEKHTEFNWNQRQSKKSNLCTLPICEPYYLPNKEYNLKEFEKSLKPEHVLQGRPLRELSITTSLQAQRWRPQPIKTREKVRSAQEKKRKGYVTQHNYDNYDNYTHIIKRVLERYDPSSNSIRRTVNKSNEARNSYLMTSTY